MGSCRGSRVQRDGPGIFIFVRPMETDQGVAEPRGGAEISVCRQPPMSAVHVAIQPRPSNWSFSAPSLSQFPEPNSRSPT